MPQISSKKKEKIQEQILHYLFSISPQSTFTSQIAQELARDEEFIKTLLTDLKSKGVLTEIKKNPSGTPYIRRQRWTLAQDTYEFYKKHQSS